MRVAVIGAGIIGLLTALNLSHRGHSVVVLERRRAGSGSSSGNAGWIVPSMTAPVPAPGVISTSLRWLLQPGSPLAISPKLALRSPGWLIDFARHCREEPHARGQQAMLDLSRDAFCSFDRLSDLDVECDVAECGLLFLSRDEGALENAATNLAQVTRAGHEQPALLGRADLQALDPALSDYPAGAVYVREERMTRPEDLIRSTLAALRARDVEIVEHSAVTGATHEGNHLVAVHTPERTFQIEHVVLAAGAWSGQVGERLGVNLPVQAGKGYSITLDSPQSTPSIAWDLIDERVAITPFPGALRLAGAMELSGISSSVNRRRLENIWRNARPYFLHGLDGARAMAWTGMRPMTPDGLPIIGRYPGRANLTVATGHGMLGLTLAPVTAEVVADLVSGDSLSVHLRPFIPDRFLH